MKIKSKEETLRLLPMAAWAMATALGSVVISGCNKQPAATTASDGSAHQHADGEKHEHNHAATAGLTTHATKLEFKTQPRSLAAGVPAIWTLKIFDTKTKKPVRNFEIVHEKMLHLIVVSKDLSWFNHIHPEYKDHGLFITRTSVPRAGTYKLYADYTPKEGAQEVAQHEVTVGGGSALPTTPSLIADKLSKSGSITKTVSGNPPQDSYQFGVTVPTYQVALMPMPAKLVVGKPATLHFQVRDRAGKPVTDLEPYLGAMGHAVIVSRDTNNYLHAHPATESAEGVKGGPDVTFHTNFPSPGLYKVWGQFQHQGRILTAAFVLRVEAGTPTMATTE